MPDDALKGGADAVKAYAQKDEFKKMAIWPGFIGVDVYFEADGSAMYTHSRWVDKSYGESAAAALKQAMAPVMEHVAKPPEPSVGPQTFYIEGQAYGGPDAGATRIVFLTLKPGAKNTLDTMLEPMTESFNTLEGLISTLFRPSQPPPPNPPSKMRRGAPEPGDTSLDSHAERGHSNMCTDRMYM